MAPPQMALYMQYSAKIYEVYLKYIAPEDIHVYSIDEVFMDVTGYLGTYGMTARELAAKMIRDVQETIGITATAGVGTNLYLAKVAMDIEAKHIQPDANGVRIAQLDERSYRQLLWSHRPLTDFWRVGQGYAKKLEENGLFTMGDIARCSIGKKQTIIMKNYYTGCLALMQSCSLIMPGDGSLVPFLTSRHTNRLPTALGPDRYFLAPILMIRQISPSGNGRYAVIGSGGSETGDKAAGIDGGI